MSLSFTFAQMKMASLRGLLPACHTNALVVLALCFLFLAITDRPVAAKPPQAPLPPQAPVLIPPCNCGCMTGTDCRCRNCCERTADPTWHPTPSASPVGTPPWQPVASAPATAEEWVRVCGPNGCRMVKVTAPTLPRPFGGGSVGDFIYDPDTGPTPSPSPLSGGCAAGNCASGSCGATGASGGRWYPGKRIFGGGRRCR